MERADSATNLKEEEEEGEHQASVGKREVSRVNYCMGGKEGDLATNCNQLFSPLRGSWWAALPPTCRPAPPGVDSY